MYNEVLASCPRCDSRLIAKSLVCNTCNIEINGEISLSPFDYLSKEEMSFLKSFLKHSGNFRAVQTDSGLSYPAVKKYYTDILMKLNILETPDTKDSQAPANIGYDKKQEAAAPADAVWSEDDKSESDGKPIADILPETDEVPPVTVDTAPKESNEAAAESDDAVAESDDAPKESDDAPKESDDAVAESDEAAVNLPTVTAERSARRKYTKRAKQKKPGEIAVEKIKEKIEQAGGSATIKLLTGIECDIHLNSTGEGLLSPKIPMANQLSWDVFAAAVELVVNSGGSAPKGKARSGAPLGSKNLPLESIEGYIAKTVHGAVEGDTVVAAGFVVCAILDWADICFNERGKVTIKPEFASIVQSFN